MISVLPVWDDASLQLRSCLPVHIPASGRPPSPLSTIPQSLRLSCVKTLCTVHRPVCESPLKGNLFKIWPDTRTSGTRARTHTGYTLSAS